MFTSFELHVNYIYFFKLLVLLTNPMKHPTDLIGVKRDEFCAVVWCVGVAVTYKLKKNGLYYTDNMNTMTYYYLDGEVIIIYEYIMYSYFLK